MSRRYRPAPLAGFVNPYIPNAEANGGLGIRDVGEGAAANVVILLPAWSPYISGDYVELLWDGVVIVRRPMAPTDTGQVIPFEIAPVVIRDFGDGDHLLVAKLILGVGGDDKLSDPVSVWVKTTWPGGRDPKPDTESINENLATATVWPDPPTDDLDNVFVVFPMYDFAAIGDRIYVSWHGQIIPPPPQQPEPLTAEDLLRTEFAIPVPRDIIEAVGGGDLKISYRVLDRVTNSSLWAPYHTQDVPIEDPNAPPSPWVEGTVDDDGRVLRLADLKNSPVTVLVEAGHGGKKGETIHVHWAGVAAGATPVPPYDTAPQTLSRDNATLTFSIPYEQARLLGEGSATATYLIHHANGTTTTSRRRTLSVEGKAVSLLLPYVVNTPGNVLDAAQHKSGALMAAPLQPELVPNGSRVTFIWSGIDEGEAESYADGSNDTYAVMSYADILALVGAPVRIKYRVEDFNATGMLLAVNESDWITLNVIDSDQQTPGLPPPYVPEAVGDILDPEALLARLMIPAPTPARATQVTARIDAPVPFVQTLPIRDPASPPSFQLLGSSFIKPNDGNKVIATYTVSASDGYTETSRPYEFSIGNASPLFIDTTRMMLVVGGSDTRQATGGKPAYTYSSSNPRVANVDSTGRVTAYDVGTGNTFVVDMEGTEVRYPFSVGEGFVFDSTPASILAGETLHRPPRGGQPPYTVTSSQPAIATVNNAGTATGQTAGVATITAGDSANGMGSYALTVVAMRDFEDFETLPSDVDFALPLKLPGLTITGKHNARHNSQNGLPPLEGRVLRIDALSASPGSIDLDLLDGYGRVAFDMHRQSKCVATVYFINEAGKEVGRATYDKPDDGGGHPHFRVDFTAPAGEVIRHVRAEIVGFLEPSYLGWLMIDNVSMIRRTPASAHEQLLQSNHATQTGTRAGPPFDFDNTPVSLEVNKTYRRTPTGGVPDYHFSSDNSAIASVATDGTVTAHLAGPAYITCEDSDTEKNSGRYLITVSAIAPPFAFPGTPVTLEVGETYTRRASGGTPPYTYTSTSTTVATVNTDGLVTALRIGRTTISARDQADGRGSYDVEVIDSAPPFYLDPTAKAMTVGETYTRTPTGGHPPYTYTSSNPAIATVNANGLVTALAVGTTTITARDTRGAIGSYVVTVSVAAPTLLAPTCSYVSGGTLDPSQVPAGGLPFTINYATILVGDYIELTWSGATSGTVTKDVTVAGAQTLTLAKSYVDASTGRSVSVAYRVLRGGSWYGPSPALGFQVKVPPPTSLTEDFEGVSAGNYTPLKTSKLEVFQGGGQPVTVGISNHPPHIVNKRASAGLADYWVRFNQPCRKVTLGFVNPDQRIAIITCDTAQYQTSETIFEISGAARTVTLPEMPQGKPIGYLYIRRRSTTSQNPYPCNVIIDNVVMTLA